jgi:hypothetical protein
MSKTTHAVLQNPAPARRTEFAMQQRPRAVVAHVLFCSSGCYSEGGFGDLGREAEGAAEEFLVFRKSLRSIRKLFCLNFWGAEGRGRHGRGNYLAVMAMTERGPRLVWRWKVHFIFDLAAVAGAGVDGHVGGLVTVW